MTNAFRRTGDLKSIGSYPVWLQRVVHDTTPHKRASSTTSCSR